MTNQARALQFTHSYLNILEYLGTSDDGLTPFVDAMRGVDETPGENATHKLDRPLMPLLESALAAFGFCLVSVFWFIFIPLRVITMNQKPSLMKCR